MISGSKVFFEQIKTLGFAGIGVAYAPVGAALTHEVRIVKIMNNTEGDMYFSLDGVTDHMFLGKGTFTLYDLQTNRQPKTDDKFVLAVGTIFYVKQVTAPVSGAVYIECIY